MKRLAAYILVLLHINFFMFTPQFDEEDAYDRWGYQQDDIDSLAEYINEVIFDHADDTSDEDPDYASDLNPAPLAYWRSQYTSPGKRQLFLNDREVFFTDPASRLISVNFDIILPPPRI